MPIATMMSIAFTIVTQSLSSAISIATAKPIAFVICPNRYINRSYPCDMIQRFQSLLPKRSQSPNNNLNRYIDCNRLCDSGLNGHSDSNRFYQSDHNRRTTFSIATRFQSLVQYRAQRLQRFQSLLLKRYQPPNSKLIRYSDFNRSYKSDLNRRTSISIGRLYGRSEKQRSRSLAFAPVAS